MPTPSNDQSSVGQDRQYKEAVEKYDAEHGKYQGNVPAEPKLPNSSPAAADPSPFKVGQ